MRHIQLAMQLVRSRVLEFDPPKIKTLFAALGIIALSLAGAMTASAQVGGNTHRSSDGETLLRITNLGELEAAKAAWGWSGLLSFRVEIGPQTWIVAQGSRTSGLPSDITAIYRNDGGDRLHLDVLLPFADLTHRKVLVENDRLVVRRIPVAGPMTTEISLSFFRGEPADCAGFAADDAVLRALRLIPVSDLEPGLPTTALGDWFTSLAGSGSAICWETNDCGEQAGDPTIDAGRIFPTCAEVWAERLDGSTFGFVVTFVNEGGVHRPSRLWQVYRRSPEGFESLHSLRDLETLRR